MKKIIEKIKQYDYFVIGLLLSIFFLKDIISFCRLYFHADFDSQAQFLWDFAALKGVKLYHDIFYPYGYLSYLKDQVIPLHILYSLITITLFLIVYFFIKKMYRNFLTSSFVFTSFVFFILKFLGVDVFSRFGVSVAYALIVPYLLLNNLSKKTLFFFGISVGLMGGLITDQFLIVFPLTLLLILFFQFSKQRKKYKEAILKAFYSILLFSVGTIIGFLPLIIYLANTGTFNSFIFNFIHLSDLALYAKIPFLPGIKSPENLFTLLIFLVSWISFLYKFCIKKEKTSYVFFAQLSLIITLFLYEQKNIIRSIDRGLTFISFLLLIIIILDFYKLISKKIKDKHLFFFLGLLLVFLSITFHSSRSLSTILENPENLTCINNNLQYGYLENPTYKLVKEKIENIQKVSSYRIFSFPADPIFYAIFNQGPPYYSNNYDSSPLYAQEKQIEYIKNNNVEFVIYNSSIKSLQDNVPNYIRTPYELKYILSNFSYYDKVGDFLILQKNKAGDSGNFVINNNFSFLLDINLSNIPKSEGMHKVNSVNNQKIIVQGSIDDMNKFLNESETKSNNAFLFIRSPLNMSEENVTIVSDDDLQTLIHFNSCSNFYCIINLSNIPLFYQDRVIKKIEESPKQKNEYKLVTIINQNGLW